MKAGMFPGLLAGPLGATLPQLVVQLRPQSSGHPKSRSWTSPAWPSRAGGVALGASAGCQLWAPASLWPVGEEAASPRGGGSDARTEDSQREGEGEAGAAAAEVPSVAWRVQRSVSEAGSRPLGDQRRASAVLWRVWEARSEREKRP